MRGYLYVMLVAAVVTYLTTPLVRRLARRIGAITPVRDRDVHTVPVPRMGGTAMVAGFWAALIVASQIPFLSPVFTGSDAPWAVLLGASAVCLLGVMDDLWSLDAVTKLAGQALAAGVMAWQGFQLVQLPVAGLTILSPGTLLLLTVLVVVVTINALNFVDGLDGLAAGIVAIAGSAFFVYSYLLSVDASPLDYSSLATMITAALVGCCIGFLPHNFHPARIFMGDSGSMLIGLLLATATIATTKDVDPTVVSRAEIVPAFLPVVFPLAVVALPVMDLSLAVVRRTRAGKMFWQPDKMHLHHRLLQRGHSHVRAVMIMYVWAAIVAFGVVSVAFVPPVVAVTLGAIAAFGALVFTLRGPLRTPGRRPAPAAGPPDGAGPDDVAGPDVVGTSGTTPDGTTPDGTTPDGTEPPVPAAGRPAGATG